MTKQSNPSPLAVLRSDPHQVPTSTPVSAPAPLAASPPPASTSSPNVAADTPVAAPAPLAASPPPAESTSAARAVGAAALAQDGHIADFTADEESDSVEYVDPHTFSYTPQPVLRSIPGNIVYTPVDLPLQRDESNVGDKSTARADLLEREVVQTFLKNAGCVVLQPLGENTPCALRNLINSFPSERITQESEDEKLNPRHLADGLGDQELPLHPFKASSLTM